MIFKADIIFDVDDDGKKRKIKLTSEQFVYMIKHCQNLNDVVEFLKIIQEEA